MWASAFMSPVTTKNGHDAGGFAPDSPPDAKWRGSQLTGNSDCPESPWEGGSCTELMVDVSLPQTREEVRVAVMEEVVGGERCTGARGTSHRGAGRARRTHRSVLLSVSTLQTARRKESWSCHWTCPCRRPRKTLRDSSPVGPSRSLG